MSDNTTFRRLDDPSNQEKTLLQLPVTDFPHVANDKAIPTDPDNNDNDDDNNDNDELVLIQLAPSNGNATDGLTMEDLIHSDSVYILGNTSESDLIQTNKFYQGGNHRNFSNVDEGGGDEDDDDNKDASNTFTPVAARLIVQKKNSNEGDNFSEGSNDGKTLELMRVETSNTYIVVPPMKITTGQTNPDKHNESSDPSNNDDNNANNAKRQKLNSDNDDNTKEMVTMPARSIGLIPGEDSPSCFFLEAVSLPHGHFAGKLRGALRRWVYDPLDPPLLSCTDEEGGAAMEDGVGVGGGERMTDLETSSPSSLFLFGYTVDELAHICRASRVEIGHAIRNRVSGAEDALLIPQFDSSSSSSSSLSEQRYGMLSEEGKQTVSMAIVAALLESDLKLAWKLDGDTTPPPQEGTETTLLMEEIRTQWHQLEAEEFFSSSRSTKGQSNQYEILAESQQHPQHLSSGSQSQFDSQSQFYTPSQYPRNMLSSSTSVEKLPDQVIWHCLRPIIVSHHQSNTSSNNNNGNNAQHDKDFIPSKIHLLPDQVAKLAAHNVFLRGTPKSMYGNGDDGRSNIPLGAGSTIWWEEEELVEAWSMRIPCVGGTYEPRVELLKGIAISEVRPDASGSGGDGSVNDGEKGGTKRRWQYFPEEGLPMIASKRIKSMLAMRDAWTVEEAVPYLEKFTVGKNGGGGVEELLGKHAKAVTLMEKDKDGKEVSVTKYVALPK